MYIKYVINYQTFKKNLTIQKQYIFLNLSCNTTLQLVLKIIIFVNEKQTTIFRNICTNNLQFYSQTLGNR